MGGWGEIKGKAVKTWKRRCSKTQVFIILYSLRKATALKDNSLPRVRLLLTSLLMRYFIICFRASLDGVVRIYETESDKCSCTLVGHREPVYAISFSPNARFIATGSNDRCLNIWSTQVDSMHLCYRPVKAWLTNCRPSRVSPLNPFQKASQ